jgi:AAA+ superfamily predicted ATPase
MDPLQLLRDAVRQSPDNLPLRRHLAESLLAANRADEAAKEFRDGLAKWPNDADLKLGLARAFDRLGKDSEAIVVVESLLTRDDPPGAAYVLHARLLARAGDVERAVRAYKRGIEADPAAADLELAARLGVDASEGEVVDGRQRAARGGGEEGPSEVEIERPRISFKDVGGMESLKEEIRLKIIHPLTHPEIYKAYGKKIGGGILMYGPPGCGKTHLARATAGEIKAGFLAVGIHDVLDMWIGNSEKQLHGIFEQARRSAPCVLFFDEVDALGASRSDMRTSGGRHLINQFLSELDGVEASNDGVLVLAATNAPWHLDSAFRRPGRFDRIVFVPPPDAPARAGILRILCQGKPLGDVDFDHVGKKTEHFSGADLKAALDVAIEDKLKDALKDGVPRPLSTKDLVAAASKVKPSAREWFGTARNYALYANQGGIYDDILKYLKL